MGTSSCPDLNSARLHSMATRARFIQVMSVREYVASTTQNKTLLYQAFKYILFGYQTTTSYINLCLSHLQHRTRHYCNKPSSIYCLVTRQQRPTSICACHIYNTEQDITVPSLQVYIVWLPDNNVLHQFVPVTSTTQNKTLLQQAFKYILFGYQTTTSYINLCLSHLQQRTRHYCTKPSSIYCLVTRQQRPTSICACHIYNTEQDITVPSLQVYIVWLPDNILHQSICTCHIYNTEPDITVTSLQINIVWLPDNNILHQSICTCHIYNTEPDITVTSLQINIVWLPDNNILHQSMCTCHIYTTEPDITVTSLQIYIVWLPDNNILHQFVLDKKEIFVTDLNHTTSMTACLIQNY